MHLRAIIIGTDYCLFLSVDIIKRNFSNTLINIKYLNLFTNYNNCDVDCVNESHHLIVHSVRFDRQFDCNFLFNCFELYINASIYGKFSKYKNNFNRYNLDIYYNDNELYALQILNNCFLCFKLYKISLSLYFLKSKDITLDVEYYNENIFILSFKIIQSNITVLNFVKYLPLVDTRTEQMKKYIKNLDYLDLSVDIKSKHFQHSIYDIDWFF